MLELCALLKINVNELLSGEHIMEEAYDRRAEENLLRQRRENEEMSRKLLAMEKALTCILLFASAVLVTCGSILVWQESGRVMGIALYAADAIVVMAGALVAVWMEQTAGYYECPDCGYRYKPTYSQALMASHIGTSRRLKCPHCGKRSYHKKVISGDK